MLNDAMLFKLPFPVGIVHITATREPVNLILAVAPKTEVECSVPVQEPSEVIKIQPLE